MNQNTIIISKNIYPQVQPSGDATGSQMLKRIFPTAQPSGDAVGSQDRR